MSPRPASPPPDSGWSSIRPYTPRLLLRTCEITSVSATFTISTSLDATFLKHPNQRHDDTLFDDVADLETLGDLSVDAPKQGIADILGKGLRVKVNEEPWEKVVLHSEVVENDAIITLYGLIPSSQYDIELGVVSGEEVIQSTIITTAPEADVANDAEESDHEQVVAPVPLQTATPETTPPSSPRRPPSPPPPRLITIEERAAQLRRTLAASNEQRDALVSQLKFSRKEAQRTDAGLRSEMEALKRTAEKNASAEQRNRQKVLALQEAIKRLHANAEEAELEAVAVEASLPDLEISLQKAHEEHERAKEEAERSELETEEALKADKKRSTDLDGELASLNNRIDKFNLKRDKFNKETIPELEEQLTTLAKEIDAIENGSPTHLPLEFDHEAHYPHHYQTPYTPPIYQNRNGSTGHLPRPPPPIQRPPDGLNQRPTGMGRLTGHSNPNVAIHPRNPTMAAHPPPRGLFMNHPTMPRPQHSNGTNIAAPTQNTQNAATDLISATQTRRSSADANENVASGVVDRRKSNEYAGEGNTGDKPSAPR